MAWEDVAPAQRTKATMSPSQLRNATIPILDESVSTSTAAAMSQSVNSSKPHRTTAGRAKQRAAREETHLTVPQEELPESGEATKLPPARSPFNKPAVLSPDEEAHAAAAQAHRQEWEQSPEGQARKRNMLDLMGNQAKGMTIQQVYAAKNPPSRDPGPVTGVRQLPGMADPHAAPRPPRWEELSEAQRSHTVKGLAMQGTSVETMIEDYGAQLDQAHFRAGQAGAERPFSQEFYSVGEPRQVISSSARDLGIPEQIHAHMNALTSPNTKFSQTSRGEIVYPNDRAATHAVRFVQQGGNPRELTNELAATGGERVPGERAQGYEKNMIKAAVAFEQHQQGVPPAEWVTGAAGEGPFESSPKTGPYSNSWTDSHPQYFVSDVHSGGGGMLPHLSADKPIPKTETGEIKLTKSGKRSSVKSEREVGIEKTPFFHSVADYVARQAHAIRGISHTREGQASQWGEEQLQRGEAGMRGAPKESDVYPTVSPTQFKDVEQYTLFD